MQAGVRAPAGLAGHSKGGPCLSAHTRRHMPAHSSTQLLQQHKPQHPAGIGGKSSIVGAACRRACATTVKSPPAARHTPMPSAGLSSIPTNCRRLGGRELHLGAGAPNGSIHDEAPLGPSCVLRVLRVCALLALRAPAHCGGAHQARAVLQPGSTTPYPPAHQAGASWQNTSWQNTTHLRVVPAQQPLLHKRPQPAEPLQDAACACGAGQCECGGVAAAAPREAGTRGAAPAPLCVPLHAGRLQHGMPAPPRAVTWPVLLIIVGQVVVLPAG